MKTLILTICLAITFISCKKDEVEATETTMHVNYFRQDCQGVALQKCLLVQEGSQLGTSDWSLFYSGIEGFEYEEGFVYTLKVRKENVANPPMDGSSIRYILVKVIAKEPV